MRMVKYWSRYGRGSSISIFGGIQNSAREGPQQHAVTGCTLSGGLDKRTSRGPFQPKFSYGLIVLWVCRTSQILIWVKATLLSCLLPCSLQNFTLVISTALIMSSSLLWLVHWTLILFQVETYLLYNKSTLAIMLPEIFWTLSKNTQFFLSS